MQKFLFLGGLLFMPLVQAKSIEGCYLTSEKITSFVSEETEMKSTYLKISKAADDFWVEGVILGANFHVCYLGSPIEGSEGPLQMRRVDNKLVYSQHEVEYGISCDLEISFHNNSLTISDSNDHCARHVFYCGARVGLDHVELPKVVQNCPDTDK
ncbi:hypothetical protein L4174_020490 [Photobacterium sp. CCB-ST2H9]|uniref:hypothetical protein n=1 Tax=Photobacterium sp. CCB-ST2H9 TaxID=2912855 RepID=UPI002004FDE8|nr:hypothetical protein [Photobacterium sp. CCB-ST2H9]UTM59094.1 hypothetical protein L4174_020490 [Photobacterium sp. CCB-ST2H9]